MIQLSPERRRAVEIAQQRLEQRRQIGFSISWSETSLRWLLGETPRNEMLIQKTRETISELNEKLLTVPNPFDTVNA